MGSEEPLAIVDRAEGADDPESDLDVAIIGMQCHFPGATNVDEFWQVLRSGAETISHFTPEDMVAAGVPAARVANPDYVRAKGVISGVENFDHEFFQFSKLEAEVMDPQQRLFLEFTWKALESAGYDSAQFPGRIGIFAGQAFNTYLLNNLRHARQSHVGQFHGIDLLIMTDKDFLTTLTAHHLGLRGPAMTVQTACSTSIVAIHQACQALLNRDCEVALAGAITVYSPQVKGYVYEPGNLISPDGHIRSFDADGRGTVYSSGMGMVVLKVLADAQRDGDTIHAVIKGSAVNNDGGRKGVFKAPSEDGIAEVAAMALAASGVDPRQVQLMEANGSGTENGDPIEVHSLTRAFRQYTQDRDFCAIGSVKSNVGHLNVAAGMAAVLKAALCVKHGEIVPTINFSSPNPAIRFEESPFRVARELRTWPAQDGPRLAAVNSYGVGGTNGHLIVAQPPAPNPTDSDRPVGPSLLVLSAKTPSALERMRAAFVELLGEGSDLPPIADICYTLQVGRRQFPYRLAVVGTDPTELAKALDNAAMSEPVGQARTAPSWWFSGQTSDTAGAGSAPTTVDDEVRAALASAGHSRSLDDIRQAPLSEAERALLVLAAQLDAARVLVPVVGVASATGAGFGALAAAVAVGELSTRQAIERLLNDEYPGGADLEHQSADLIVAAGAVRTPGAVAPPPGPRPGWVDSLARLWLGGTTVDWAALHRGSRRRRVPLPTYSFEPVRCWVDIPAAPTAHVYDAAL